MILIPFRQAVLITILLWAGFGDITPDEDAFSDIPTGEYVNSAGAENSLAMNPLSIACTLNQYVPSGKPLILHAVSWPTFPEAATRRFPEVRSDMGEQILPAPGDVPIAMLYVSDLSQDWLSVDLVQNR